MLHSHLSAQFYPFGIISGSVGYLAVLQRFQINYGPTQPPVLWVLGLLKWLDHETNHPSLVVRLSIMSGTIPPFPHVPSWCAQKLP
jgi:hypothetical protein